VGDKKEQPLIIFAENIHLLAYKTGLHVNPGIKIWWYCDRLCGGRTAT
jgi:hypothetical protein